MYQILIVDDSVLSRSLLTHVLSAPELEIISVNSAKELFCYLERHTPDLILLDLVLTDKSGYEVCAEMRERGLARNVPIVFITSSNDEESILRGFEAGAIDYICKPFLPAVLKARVECHLQNKLMADQLRITNHKLKKAMEELRLQSYKDSLTSLYNRRFFLEEMGYWKKWVEDSDGAFLFLMDVDHFKTVNDTYGHCTGDYVLYSFSDILSSHLGEMGAACRWGGDEFLLLVCDVPEAEIVAFAERIRSAVERYPFHYDGHTFRCSTTIGIVPFHGDLSIEENVALADRALYVGKARGKNCCVWYSASQELPLPPPHGRKIR